MFTKVLRFAKEYLLAVLVFGVGMGFVAFIYCIGLKRGLGMYGNCCVADYMDSCFSGGTFFNLLLVPLNAVFVVSLVNKNSSTMNYYLRHSSRNAICIKNICKNCGCGLLVTVATVLSFSVVAGLFCNSNINWSLNTSYFFQTHLFTVDISFVEFLVWSVIKLLCPVLFFSTVIYAFSLKFKMIYAFAIAVVISTMNIFGYIKFVLNYLMPVENNAVYINRNTKLMLFVLFPVLIVATSMLALRFMRKKDLIT